MVSRFARRVGRAIRAQALWGPGDRVAVALSGGADSTALTLALVELAPHAPWQLAGLIHVNHNLRGHDAAEDEAFCRSLAERLGLEIDVTHVDVAARRSVRPASVESAARDLRYEAFGEAAARLGATVVASAHTCDDQAETVLLRLLRGSTSRGVSAIRPRRGIFARPLLDRRRAEVEAYLAQSGQPFRHDRSNEDTSVPRNRLRHRLVPVINDIWPGGVGALARFARLAQDDEAWMSRAAAEATVELGRNGVSGVELKRGALAALPGALARRVVRDAIERAGGRPGAAGVQTVLRQARSDNRTVHLDLAGVTVEMTADAVVLQAPTTLDEARGASTRELAVPGEARLDETGGRILASLSYEASIVPSLRSAGPVGAFQRDQLVLPLLVRSRRPGDRIRPLGAPGRRRVQDLLVDRKIPIAERDRVPIVEDGAGRIVWVAGVAVAHGARVTRPEAGMVILEIKKDKA